MSVIRTLPSGATRLRWGDQFLLQRVSIHVNVVLRGDGPVEVLRHGLLTQLENVLRSVEPGCDGPADAIVQRTDGGFPEFEPRAVAGRLVIILHRVVEAARGADDGQGAVLEGVNLVESAGLVQRRHEEEIATRLDEMAEFGREPDVRTDATGIRPGQVAKEVFGVHITVAEYDELHDHIVESGGQRLAQETESLLMDKAADHTEQRDVGAFFQVKMILERGHYQTCQRHRVLKIAIDYVAARVESLAAEIGDVVVEFPQAELFRVEAQQAEIGRSQSKLEALGAHLGPGAALVDLERVKAALNPVVTVPFRARRMLEVLESESAVELIVGNSGEPRVLLVVAVDRNESVAHAHPDAPVGEDRPELVLLEFHRVDILRLARRGGNHCFADERSEERRAG